MSGTAAPSRAQNLWALAAVIPFLLSIALLGYAFSNQVLVMFAGGWLALQMFGYSATLKMAKGDTAHYLVKAQVLLNWTVLALFVAMLAGIA
ncbi:pyridoxal phosphate biosynthetic protein [Altererythrobacter litoralis]|uniref:Pyridoxal phosphate biosynthetic protein n=1 Tax=Altererythrobacter litoralis TaxID=3113904 RepID=A0ABU7GEV7_9SPHN|nr:pyridoxal phosphate biosynthetic protein [Erythrobacteraceae bacterium 1XM1-14]